MDRQIIQEMPTHISRGPPVKAAPPDFTRRGYNRELKPLIKELNALLPCLQKRASPELYAAERNELMRLTGRYYDDSLDIYELEALLQHMKWHRQIFVTAIAEINES